MLFIFKRDDEGRERMFVGDVCVFMFANTGDRRGYQNASIPGVADKHLIDAIKHADEAGFWERRMPRNPFCDQFFARDEVTIDVPVADNTILSVTTGEDHS